MLSSTVGIDFPDDDQPGMKEGVKRGFHFKYIRDVSRSGLGSDREVCS